MPTFRVRSCLRALAAGGTLLMSGALALPVRAQVPPSVPAVPAAARIGDADSQPVAPIAVGTPPGTPATAGNATASAMTVPAALSTAARRTSVVTSGAPGSGSTQGATGPAVGVPVATAQPAAGTTPARNATAGTAGAPTPLPGAVVATPASGGATVPAAVHTRGRVRPLARQLEPAGGGPRTVDPVAAMAALKTQAGAATPLDAPLPGLGMAPGAERPVKPVTIHCRAGENSMIPVALNYPNRFDTPFVDPHVIDTKGDDSNMRVANSVFVTAQKNTPFAIWIVDGKAGSQMCSLTLIPQNIPAQNLVLQMEGGGRPGAAGTGGGYAPGAGSEETGRESEYTVGLRTLMRTVARGIAPRGYSEEELDVGVAVSNGIQAQPEHLYAGSKFDVYVYRLTNRSPAPVTLSEEAFGTKGVRAVTFFPLVMLPPGQSTRVFIIADRPDSDGEATDTDVEAGLQ